VRRNSRSIWPTAPTVARLTRNKGNVYTHGPQASWGPWAAPCSPPPPQGMALAELQCNKALNHYLDVALAHHNLPSLESGLCMAKPDAPPPARLSRTLIHHLRERVTRRSSLSRLLFGITLAVMPGTEEKASRRSSSPPIGLILFQEAIKVSLFIV
jgi:hypothetical protein